MKKCFAILLIAALMFTLTGCFGKKSAESTEAATAPPALETYAKDYFGLQQYLMDRSLIPSVDLKKYNPATPNEPASDDVEGDRTAVYYTLLGADRGIRYTLGPNVFIEIYDFTNADNQTAADVLAKIKKDGTITVVEGQDELTGKISKSGKFVILYNAKAEADYDKITAALENW